MVMESRKRCWSESILSTLTPLAGASGADEFKRHPSMGCWCGRRSFIAAFSLMLCTSLEYHITVTLPLWILSVTFHHLIPLALTSLLISMGVCVAAGAQAALPKGKRRWWSRPLVATLFFLQPVVRGWARYQGRLTLRRTPIAAQQTLDS